MLDKQKIKLLTKQELQIWLYSFLVLTLSFCPLIFNFIWGNHDWMPIIKSSNIASGLIEGRFSQYLFTSILFDGHILPVLNTLVGFLIYTFCLSLLASRFFEYKNTLIKSSLITIAIATLPYINEITYFQFIVFSQLCWPLIITISLISAKKAFYTHPLLNTFFCFVFLFLSIGGYPASANLYVVATILYILKDYLENNNLKQSFFKTIPFLVSLILSFALLYITYKYLKTNNLMLDLYNNDVIGFYKLFAKIPTIFIQSIQSLIQPQPFFSLTFKLITSIIILLFLYLLFTKKQNISNAIAKIFIILILFIALKFSALLANENKGDYFADNDPISFMVRADFYAIPSFILFCLYYILQNSKKFTQNITLVFIVLLIFLNINSNLNYSKVQYLGFNAETKLLNRMTNRITSSENFNQYNYYTIVQAGEIPLRLKYYTQHQNEKHGLYTLKTPYVRHWLPNEFHNFYAITEYVKPGSAINPYNMSYEMKDFLSTKISFWPSPKSTFINDNYTIIILTKDAKKLMQKQFNSLARGLK